MNIVTVNQLVSVNILLERDEALAALKDPGELQRKLREALGDIAPVSLGGRHNKRKRAAPKGKSRRGGGTASASTMTSCPRCGKEVKSRGLGVHMMRKHKTLDAFAAAD